MWKLGPPWLQQTWVCNIQDSERRKQSKPGLFHAQGLEWRSNIGGGPEYKRDPGKLADFQRSFSSSSRMVYSNKQEIKQKYQECCLHEWARTSLRSKKKAYKRWKQGEITWEEYGNIVSTRKDVVRKAKPFGFETDKGHGRQQEGFL